MADWMSRDVHFLSDHLISLFSIVEVAPVSRSSLIVKSDGGRSEVEEVVGLCTTRIPIEYGAKPQTDGRERQ